LPQNPIGLENMDNGERFDLRLPYSERGYEDPDADLGNMIGKFMNNLFGKKNDEKKGNFRNCAATGTFVSEKVI
jgi:hypothetical protein